MFANKSIAKPCATVPYSRQIIKRIITCFLFIIIITIIIIIIIIIIIVVVVVVVVVFEVATKGCLIAHLLSDVSAFRRIFKNG